MWAWRARRARWNRAAAAAGGALLVTLLVGTVGPLPGISGTSGTSGTGGTAGAAPLVRQSLPLEPARPRAASGQPVMGPLVPAPPSYSVCRQQWGFACYDPVQLRQAYNVGDLLDAGDDGAGQTIVIIDSIGSPTITADLQEFDAAYGLPAPPTFKVLSPLGTVAFNGSNQQMTSWAMETSLDVEWAHAMAPAAGLVLLTSPVIETEGTHGLTQFLALERYALKHHLGDVISQSWAATENTLFTVQGRSLMAAFDAFYKGAGSQGVTVLASSGDTGATNYRKGSGLYHDRVVGFPASSPWVTTVGGTTLDAPGGRYSHETVWNGAEGASGGGVSQYEPEPSYQLSLPREDQSRLDGHRAMPDVAFNAAPGTGVPVSMSFPGASLLPHAGDFTVVGGTSEGSPAWAGIVADLDQAVGGPLGFLNPLLYRLGDEGLLERPSFHDVTKGDNSRDGVQGYTAKPGWDLTTGWGTPNLKGLLSLITANS